MPKLQVGDLCLHYREWGEGPETLLLLHGSGGSALWWQRVAEHLPTELHAVAPDLRGCGHSDKPAPPWSIADLAADVGGFLDALTGGRVYCAAHSLGAAVALALALERPGLFEGLVLINPVPLTGLRLELAPFEALVAEPSLLRLGLRRLAPTAAVDDFYEAVLQDAQANSLGSLLPNAEALAAFDVGGEVGRLTVPTLLIYGELDALVGRAEIEAAQAQLAGCTLECWPGVGHSPPLEAPERLAGRLVQFIKEAT